MKKSDPVYEQLGKSIKISPSTEDAYVFKDNWLSEFNNGQ